MSEKLRELELLVSGYSGCMNEASKDNQLEAIIHCINTINEPKHETSIVYPFKLASDWCSENNQAYKGEWEVLYVKEGFMKVDYFSKRNTEEYIRCDIYIVSTHHGKPETK